jgi:integrase
MGKNGPARRVAEKSWPYFILALDGGLATAFGFGFSPQRRSACSGDGDFLFPSLRRNGTQPIAPDMVLKKFIRLAFERADGHHWQHNRLARLSAQPGDQSPKVGVDVKVAQELLRHANPRTTMDLNTHVVSRDKRNASQRQIELLLD